jgi:hypothetical protein
MEKESSKIPKQPSRPSAPPPKVTEEAAKAGKVIPFQKPSGTWRTQWARPEA